MADFKDIIKIIEKKIGNTITRQNWTATLISIIERKQRSIKILVSFTKDQFIFEKELKLVDQHFDEDTKYNDEIIRQLKRLNDFDQCIIDLKSQIDNPNISNKWKGFITEVIELNPIEVVIKVNYAKTGMLIERDFKICEESFITKQNYLTQIDFNVDRLNAPIQIGYYQSLI